MEKNLRTKSLTAKQRFDMIYRVIHSNERVTAICKEFGISRKTFYKFKKRYDSAIFKKPEVLKNKKRESKGTKIDTDIQKTIIEIVKDRPSYGPQRILLALKQEYENQQDLDFSVNCLYVFLKKNELNTYSKRIAFRTEIARKAFSKKYEQLFHLLTGKSIPTNP